MANVDNTTEEKTLPQRLLDKGRRSPFLTASIASFAGICAYGAYNFKRRQTSIQMYIIQMRVAAQATAVGCLTFGMVYHMIRKHVLHKEDEP